MSLTLWRRHQTGCDTRNPEKPAFKLSAKAKRLYNGCECTIWIYGHLENGKPVPRQSTKFSDMAEAEALRASMLSSGKDEAVHGPRIADCIDDYLISRRHELGAKTAKQYELLLGRLKTYCGRQGVFFMRELTVDLLERFKHEGLPDGQADTTKSTSVWKLLCFLRESLRREWIKDPLAEKVRPHAAVYEQKEPYSEDELKSILEASETINGGTRGFAKHPKTFRLLLELMLETGMRVGDAVRFNPDHAIRGERMWVYTYQQQKRKRTIRPKAIEAFISDGLMKSIKECAWLSSDLPFYYGDSKDPSYIANQVYERMQTVGARCDVKDCRPHRLRDTFAVRMLIRGVPLEDVSRLLGHSSVKVTEAYYAKWVAARKVRLEGLVAEALMNTDGNGLGNRNRNIAPAPRRGRRNP